MPSKNRGGSKMSSLVSVTWPCSATISRPPSPSTLLRTGTLMRCVMGPPVMFRGLLAERLGAGGEGAERADQVAVVGPQFAPARGKRRRVRRLHRSEAAEAATVE